MSAKFFLAGLMGTDMRDWRLDSELGGISSVPGTVICGVAPRSSFGVGLGGGAGQHFHIPLERICRRHAVVANGRVFTRGFRVHPGAMTLEASFTIPAFGITAVLGYGGIVKERALTCPAEITDIPDELFPVPDGITFGSFPFSELPYITSTDRGTIINKDRRYQCFYGTTNPYNTANTWLVLRTGPYHFLRYDVEGEVIRCYLVDLTWRHATLIAEHTPFPGDISSKLSKIKMTIRGFGSVISPTTGVFFPSVKGAPHYHVDFNDPFNFIPYANSCVGPQKREGFWDDPNTDGINRTNDVLNVNRQFRLFDGRFLVMPKFNTNSHTLYLFRPEDDGLYVMDPLNVDTGNSTDPDHPLLYLPGTTGGTSRWKMPVQMPNGKVVMLPDNFPGNYSLIFDPSTNLFIRSIMGIGYAGPSVKHTFGQPTLDGRIIYMQTYGAALADMNMFLTVWPDEERSEISNKDLLTGSVMATFDYGYTLGDGCIFFAASQYGCRANHSNTDTSYSQMVYNPYADDYKLYKYPAITSSPVIYNATNTNDSQISYNRPERFMGDYALMRMTPEFDWITTNGSTPYTYTFQDAAATKSMGAFFRQAYYGYQL
jgi:hypothetical protein